NVAAIEDTAAVVGEVTVAVGTDRPSSMGDVDKSKSLPLDSAKGRREVRAAPNMPPVAGKTRDPFGSSAVSVSVEIKIDANTSSPEQVGATIRETLAALRESTEIS